MFLDGLFKWMLPRESQFFSYLDKIAANLVQGGHAFGRLREADTSEQLQEIAQHVKHIESEGDDLAGVMHDALDQTFVTPIDREDLHALTAALESVLDSLEGTAARFALFGFERPTRPMLQLVDVIVECVGTLAKTVSLLGDMKKVDEIRMQMAHVKRLENEADEIYRAALGALFAQPPEPAVLIRRKELLESLERTVDLAAHAMTVIRAVIVKNS